MNYYTINPERLIFSAMVFWGSRSKFIKDLSDKSIVGKDNSAYMYKILRGDKNSAFELDTLYTLGISSNWLLLKTPPELDGMPHALQNKKETPFTSGDAGIALKKEFLSLRYSVLEDRFIKYFDLVQKYIRNDNKMRYGWGEIENQLIIEKLLPEYNNLPIDKRVHLYMEFIDVDYKLLAVNNMINSDKNKSEQNKSIRD